MSLQTCEKKKMLKHLSIASLALLTCLILVASPTAPAMAQEAAAAKVLNAVPAADVGMKTTCSVCQMKITVRKDSPAAEYQGKNYYFCSDWDRDTFIQDPQKYAQANQPAAIANVPENNGAAKVVKAVPKADLGLKTNCPVCQMAITVHKHTPVVEYQGKDYYFCSKTDRDTFLKDPAKFAQAAH
ncbi:MAG: YHS domain-containing protein [Candidatus Binataceae bacterium]